MVKEEKKLVSTKEKTAGGFSQSQIKLIKDTIARGASDDELKIFLMACNRYKLDPFTNQIHFVRRKKWNKEIRQMEDTFSIQTGIDGYRAIAERSGQLAGISDVRYDEKSEQSNSKYPIKATVAVQRIVNGEKVPFTATARWSEYAPYGKDGKIVSPMWIKMPYLMLGKCAEALALRKAFPNDLSGIYTSDEMSQANVIDIPVQKPAQGTPPPANPLPQSTGQPQSKDNSFQGVAPRNNHKPATQPQIKKICATFATVSKMMGLSENVKEYVQSSTGKTSMNDLTILEASSMIEHLSQQLDAINNQNKEKRKNEQNQEAGQSTQESQPQPSNV